MAHNLQSVTQKALATILAALGFTAYTSCTDEPDLYGAPLPNDSTQVNVDNRALYGTTTRTYVHDIDK